MSQKYEYKLELGFLLASIFGYSLSLFVFRYGVSFERLFSSVLDLAYSIGEYFTFLFRIDADIPDRVNVIPDIDLQQFLPFDLEDVRRKLVEMWPALITKENLLGFYRASLEALRDFLLWILLGLPLVLVLRLVLVESQLVEGDPLDRNKDSTALKRYKKLTAAPKRILAETLDVLKEYLPRYKVLLWILLVVWLCALNVATIVVEAVAFYFFFAATFNFADFLSQLVKLFIDLVVMFSGAPFVLWLVGAAVLFHYLRCRIGISVLKKNEKKNKGFIKKLPIVKLNVGDMGRKKTTLLVDMALSEEEIQRFEALERMEKIALRYPTFPFINLEKSLRRQIEKHAVYNLATCKEWMAKKERIFHKYSTKANIFRYDFSDREMFYDDNLTYRSIWTDLSTYAQLYLLYVVSSTIIIANLSIRQDDELIDNGHFPERKYDYFECPSAGRSKDKFSHILDFDMLRLGKTVLEHNPNDGAFEYGVVCITEIGKERGNNLENQELKKNSDQANPKNDSTNAWIKLCRHSSTVDHHPFVSIYADEQRASSWGADARDMAKIVNIKSADDERLAIPLYFLEDLIIEKILDAFGEFYREYRQLRSDNTLSVYLLKRFVSFLFKYDLRIKNKYGYFRCELQLESGDLQSDVAPVEEHEYYLSKKKIYSDRFSTDCFADFFNEAAKNTGVGLDDVPTYKGVKATFEEMKLQNSYFIRGISDKFEKKNAGKLKSDSEHLNGSRPS